MEGSKFGRVLVNAMKNEHVLCTKRLRGCSLGQRLSLRTVICSFGLVRMMSPSRHFSWFCIILLGVFATFASGQTPDQVRPIGAGIKTQKYDPWVVMQRGECYGSCPAYKVSIFSDGTVEYNGLNFVKIKGPSYGKITDKQVRELKTLISRTRFFALRQSYGISDDRCTAMMTDSATVEIKVRRQSQSKSVRHYLGCFGGSQSHRAEMKRLKELEEAIDRIIAVEQWIGTSEERKNFSFPPRPQSVDMLR